MVFEPPDTTWTRRTTLPDDISKTALEYLKKQLNPSIFEIIAQQSNLYAMKRDTKALKMTTDEAEQLVGILLHTGIVP